MYRFYPACLPICLGGRTAYVVVLDVDTYTLCIVCQPAHRVRREVASHQLVADPHPHLIPFSEVSHLLPPPSSPYRRKEGRSPSATPPLFLFWHFPFCLPVFPSLPLPLYKPDCSPPPLLFSSPTLLIFMTHVRRFITHT